MFVVPGGGVHSARIVAWFASPLIGGLCGHSSWMFYAGATGDQFSIIVGKDVMNTTCSLHLSRRPRRHACHHGAGEVERPLLSFVVVVVKTVAFGVLVMAGS